MKYDTAWVQSVQTKCDANMQKVYKKSSCYIIV